MNSLFELLFLTWCPSYNPKMVPDYLQSNPVRAYGQYAFREGFQLTMCLAVSSLWPHREDT